MLVGAPNDTTHVRGVPSRYACVEISHPDFSTLWDWNPIVLVPKLNKGHLRTLLRRDVKLDNFRGPSYKVSDGVLIWSFLIEQGLQIHAVVSCVCVWILKIQQRQRQIATFSNSHNACVLMVNEE